VAKLGVNKLITLLKEHCRGLRAHGDTVSLVTAATEPFPDQQVDDNDKTFLPCTRVGPSE
jgi:hypothetical protein